MVNFFLQLYYFDIIYFLEALFLFNFERGNVVYKESTLEILQKDIGNKNDKLDKSLRERKLNRINKELNKINEEHGTTNDEKLKKINNT